MALLIVGRVLSGLAAGIFTGTATAALADLAGAGQGRRATMVATGSNMGGLGLEALLAGILTFWVDLGLVLLAIRAVWAVPETVAVGLAATSLPFVVAAAVVAGLGQGLCMRAGLEAVTTQASAQHRAGIASAFFIVMYIAIALPVIGEGLATTRLGLRTAGIAFTLAVAAIAALALATLIRGRSRPASLPASA